MSINWTIVFVTWDVIVNHDVLPFVRDKESDLVSSVLVYLITREHLFYTIWVLSYAAQAGLEMAVTEALLADIVWISELLVNIEVRIILFVENLTSSLPYIGLPLPILIPFLVLLLYFG